MRDCIYRDAAISELRRWNITADRPRTWPNAIDKAVEVVEAIPAADVRPVVRGKWINPSPDSEMCSACEVRFLISSLFAVGGNEEPNFCPNCGAMMEES